MQQVELKLKQASAVLGVPAKDLQNLVQFGVVRPKKTADRYWFDMTTLLEAKVAWYLKEALGVSAGYLTRIVQAFSETPTVRQGKTADVLISSRLSPESATIEVRIPLRRLVSEIRQQLPVANVLRDLPRGRKRAGWKQEFLRSIREAATDLGHLTEAEILQTIREHRRAQRAIPEITVAFEATKKTA
jgi:hypothetical protein